MSLLILYLTALLTASLVAYYVLQAVWLRVSNDHS